MDRHVPDSDGFAFDTPFREDPESFEADGWNEGQWQSESAPSPFVSEADAFAPDMAALQGLLAREAGPGSDAAERAKAAAALVVGPTLRRGSAGPAVGALQRALARLGHSVADDGRFGPGTERAVREFQSRAGLAADGVAGPRTKAAIAAALGGGQSPAPTPPQPRPAPSAMRRLVVDRHPLIRAHRGTAPDLVLRWNDLGSAGEVDVVVHFHGYSGRQAAMRIDRDKEASSGLDFTDPANPGVAGRVEPTLGILPRGNWFGGKSGAGYDFPALVRPSALQALIRDSLDRVGNEVGRRLAMRRLILTGHSGGGAPVSAILAHTDPDEVHVFDGTYGSGATIARWAERRIARELASPGPVPPALRVLFRPGSPTAPQAEAIGRAICTALSSGATGRLRPRFRIDATSVAHNDIPARFGWRLLANPAADLPGATSRACPGASGETGEEWFAQEETAMDNRHQFPHDPTALAWDEDEGDRPEPFGGEALDWLDLESEQPHAFALDESEGFETDAFDPQWESAEWFDPEGPESEAEWLKPEARWPEPEARSLEPEAEWLEPETFELDARQSQWFTSEPSGTEWPAGEEFEPFEPAEAEWEQGEQAFEPPDGLPGEAPGPDISTLDALLEAEAGLPGLADRLKAIAAFVIGPTLQRGSSGPAVEALQRALEQLGHAPGAIDGKFGPGTERAVRGFQSSGGLTVDGVVGPRTKAAIAFALRGGDPAPSPSPLPAPPLPGPAPSALGDRIAKIAEREYARWHASTKLRETDTAAVPILQQYYRDGVKMSVTAAELQDTSWQKAHPWSAVFVSFVVRTAGVGHLFRCAAAHQVYVAAARKNRLLGDASNPFWAYRANEVAPEVGDLVCASRNNSGATYDNIGDPGKWFATHCDIVAEVRPGSLRVIGGNVNQNVDAKTIRTLPDGRLDLSGAQSRFFAVVRCRGAVGGSVPGH